MAPCLSPAPSAIRAVSTLSKCDAGLSPTKKSRIGESWGPNIFPRSCLGSWESRSVTYVTPSTSTSLPVIRIPGAANEKRPGPGGILMRSFIFLKRVDAPSAPWPCGTGPRVLAKAIAQNSSIRFQLSLTQSASKRRQVGWTTTGIAGRSGCSGTTRQPRRYDARWPLTASSSIRR